MSSMERYRLFANVLRYPGPALEADARECLAMLQRECHEAAEELVPFMDWVSTTPLHEAEEVYARTFHIQAVCYLDLGYVIFGEDYKRGEFLVNMKREQAEAGNDCGDELPDNLVNVLNLLPLMHDKETLQDLGSRIIIPALHNMLAEFDSARMEMRDKALRRKHNAIILEGRTDANIYRYVLGSLMVLLRTDFNEIAKPTPIANDAFLHGSATCGTCSTPHSLTAK